MFILVDKNNVIVAFADLCNVIDNGIYTVYNGHECIYPKYLNMVIINSIPDGTKPQKHKYINNEFVLNENYDNTEEKQSRKKEIQNELENLDKYVSRGLEDIIDLLVAKSVIKASDLPQYVKNRKTQKESLRDELANLN